jgi:hypothetical protein
LSDTGSTRGRTSSHQRLSFFACNGFSPSDTNLQKCRDKRSRGACVFNFGPIHRVLVPREKKAQNRKCHANDVPPLARRQIEKFWKF